MFTFFKILFCVIAVIVLGPLALAIFVLAVALGGIGKVAATSGNVMYADYAIRRGHEYYKRL